MTGMSETIEITIKLPLPLHDRLAKDATYKHDNIENEIVSALWFAIGETLSAAEYDRLKSRFPSRR